MFAKKCFKSRPFGFFFFNFRCNRGLVGTSEAESSFLRSTFIKSEEGGRGQDKERELRRAMCILYKVGYRRQGYS